MIEAETGIYAAMRKMGMGIPESGMIGTPRTTTYVMSGRKRLPLVARPFHVYPLRRQ
jgi:hypothetical protein